MECYAMILSERGTHFYDALNQNKQSAEVLCNVFST